MVGPNGSMARKVGMRARMICLFMTLLILDFVPVGIARPSASRGGEQTAPHAAIPAGLGQDSRDDEVAVPRAEAISPAAPKRTLSFESRVAAQRAIEAVYWRNRLWPAENRAPKPPLDAVIPESMIRRKVEEYLRKSNFLAAYWGRPITPEQLQAEAVRMARGSERPGLLAQLFEALHDDPFLIAECLARPVLADRLVRNLYSRDERLHGPLRNQVERSLREVATIDDLKRSGGRYAEVTWSRRATLGEGAGQAAHPGAVLLDDEEWDRTLRRLSAVLSSSAEVARELEIDTRQRTSATLGPSARLTRSPTRSPWAPPADRKSVV